MINFFSTSRRQSCICCSQYPAFSLVEVVLALGIATFGILIIVALLPVGVRSTKDSLDESGAINVLGEVTADRQATPFGQASTVYQLPALTNTLTAPVTNLFGITEADQYSAQLGQSRYRVQCIVTPPVSGRLDPYRAYIKVSWPAPTTNASGFVEEVITFPQP